MRDGFARPIEMRIDAREGLLSPRVCEAAATPPERLGSPLEAGAQDGNARHSAPMPDPTGGKNLISLTLPVFGPQASEIAPFSD